LITSPGNPLEHLTPRNLGPARHYDQFAVSGA
jgi:hypothetical protein